MHYTLDIQIGEVSREQLYEQLLPQIKALLEGEDDLVANLANVAAVLREGFGFLWVGFYLVKGDELVLGPFQGSVACTRIGHGRGVCGTAWVQKKSLLVSNVDEFEGHIACSSLSRSEVVVPLTGSEGLVWGVLDVDSDRLNDFSEIDLRYLGLLAVMLSDKC